MSAIAKLSWKDNFGKENDFDADGDGLGEKSEKNHAVVNKNCTKSYKAGAS